MNAKEITAILGMEEPNRRVMVRIGDQLHEINQVVLYSLNTRGRNAGPDSPPDPIELIAQPKE